MVAYPVHGNIGALFNALYGDGTNVYLATLNPELKGKQLNVSESEPYLIVDAWGEVLRYRHNLEPSAMVLLAWRIRNKIMISYHSAQMVWATLVQRQSGPKPTTLKTGKFQ